MGPETTILYVEDEPATREQISRLLKTRGFSVLIAENGRQGLELFRHNRPELILSDIMMPAMNGLDMARAIKAECAQCQIIVMTAFNDTDYLLDAIDIGINQFVLKPVQIGKLLAAIEHCQAAIQMRRRLEQLQAESLKAKKIEAVGILAGGMAHDFNNLLQVIMGSVSLARLHMSNPHKLNELLDMADKSCLQARELSQHLLTMARGGEVYMQTTELPALVRHTLEQYRADDSFPFDLFLPDDLAQVNVDQHQLEQVVTSLVTNAVESMPQGGPIALRATNCSIEAEQMPGLSSGSYVHLEIQDNGHGIQPENLPRIFDPYFTTKQMGSQKGTGLGLTLCHAIIRRHHGALTVESEPGRGTTVNLYLPAAS